MIRTLSVFFLFFFYYSSNINAQELSENFLVHDILQKNDQDADLHFRMDATDRKVLQFYRDRDFQPVWFQGSRLNSAGQYALQTLKNAGQEGLNPQDYHLVLRNFLFLELHLLSPEKVAEYETLLTKYIIFYIKDLDGERLNPQKISKQLYIKVDMVDPYEILSNGMKEDPSGKWLTELTVHHPEYQQLKEVLARYRNIEQKGEWTPLKLPENQKITLGTNDAFVEALKTRLILEGYLKEGMNNSVFDSSIEQALKEFQHYHGLEADGRLGKETLVALNVSVKDRIDQILLSMERWRWLPENKGEHYILVNIAGYYLQAFENEKKILQMPVIIGRNYRQTPVFSSKIDFVRFNPSWYVPHSIAVKDKLPLLRSDPSYFNTKGYHIYDESGEAVNPEEVDWSDVDSSSFDYRIVQDPGSANALGKLFFHINTPFDVFLHGTPDVDLFRKEKRSFSSGCIRVFDPVSLAFFLLNNPEKWSQETIIQVTQGNQTQTLPLEHPVNIYVTYQTVWIDDQNQPYFVEDIYQQDKAIKKVLESRKTVF
jgi:murein L,D-transpeptidase YcbB/YkuD